MGTDIRSAADADVPRIAEIYAHYVRTALATFEIDPPSVEEMARRRGVVLARDLPYLVADLDGRVAGYAYVSPYNSRMAYRFSVEDSIYIHPEYARKGIGRRLLAELIARTEKCGCRQMVAVIGDSSNVASIGLHAEFGFRHVGVLRSVGFKFDRWVDTVLMQRELAAARSRRFRGVNEDENPA
jgi:L-amino acid N-acyltransferase YncA